MRVKRMEGGTCMGGVALTANIAAPMEFPAMAVAIMDDDGNGFLFSRDEAYDLLLAIRHCLHDG